MRDYKEVTLERYEQDDFSGKGIINNEYSCINPVGNYGAYKEIQLLRKYIRLLMKATHKNLDELAVLDAGCGNGLVTRLLSNLLGNARNVYGFEFSENRLKYCKSMNGSICYEWGNLVEKIPDFYNCNMFDGIMAFDVLSHLRVEKDVVCALTNIYNSLSENGLFLWYDLNANSHYDNLDKDTQGFSDKEMKEYSKKAGFREVWRGGYYRNITLAGHTRSIYYMAKDYNIFLLEFLEKVLPLKYTINIRIYKKECD